MKPLAYRIRPTEFKNVYGQDHLVSQDGVLSMMLEKSKILSFILYGPPGTGKTTIANIFANKSNLETYFFNASTDSKQKLKDIVDTTVYKDILIVIDEIHRMKKDTQDYLLPFMENGKATVIGLTTLNPYQSVNPAIRSRCHLYEVKKLEDEDLKKAVLNGIQELEVDITIDQKALDEIIRYSNHEIRTALNLLESASLILEGNDILTAQHVRRVSGKKQLDLDNHEDHFYDLLSALQKSIRGSDVDAAVHYLARLIILGDLLSIIRRLLVIAYEDIGLANPLMGQKVLAATEAALKVGLPEARIMLGVIVVDMALSPKSNTGYLAIDEALHDIENNDCGVLPDHAVNRKIKMNPEIYHYPHSDENSLNDQSYLPNLIKDKTYFHPKDESSYEKALSDRLKIIDKIKHKKR
ncbi:replication-associated recombination protein A [Mariniplasma anaerobium]|uniref:Recombinase RarA n=1 Tax=Mariniplasma anaerobium TaxID=2735436 RepID=A0A7U9XVL9_9MOLU|nr:replication-associated recombination protein A [Mariniplasma anaerobium]BCR35973.1 recombinase RarA [Mariniplasma anaerobium]